MTDPRPQEFQASGLGTSPGRVKITQQSNPILQQIQYRSIWLDSFLLLPSPFSSHLSFPPGRTSPTRMWILNTRAIHAGMSTHAIGHTVVTLLTVGHATVSSLGTTRETGTYIRLVPVLAPAIHHAR